MATQPAQFSALPTEIRLQIWELALPGPRVVELNLVKPRRGRRFWGTNTPPLALLRVCHEAREVVLKSYEPISAWNWSQSSWRRCFIDYSKDAFYFSDEAYGYLKDSLNPYSSYVETVPIVLGKTQFLAIDSKYDSRYGSSRWRFRDIESSVYCLASVFRDFKELAQLNLVIDGRDVRFEGSDELVEPTEEYEDSDEMGGREMMLEWISRIVEEVKIQNPNLRVPLVRLNLLINGRESFDFKRRWDYRNGRCHVGPPT